MCRRGRCWHVGLLGPLGALSHLKTLHLEHLAHLGQQDTTWDTCVTWGTWHTWVTWHLGDVYHMGCLEREELCHKGRLEHLGHLGRLGSLATLGGAHCGLCELPRALWPPGLPRDLPRASQSLSKRPSISLNPNNDGFGRSDNFRVSGLGSDHSSDSRVSCCQKRYMGVVPNGLLEP